MQTVFRYPFGMPAIRTVTVVLVVATLAACSALSSTPPNPADIVKERANARWQALVKGEFDKAYAYATPGFRAVMSPEAFRNKFGTALSWTNADVARVECASADKCTAVVRIEFIPMTGLRKGGTMSTHVEETWLSEGGQWWYFQNI